MLSRTRSVATALTAAALPLASAVTAAPAHAGVVAPSRQACSTWRQIGNTAVYKRTCTNVTPALGSAPGTVSVVVSVRNVGAATRTIALTASVIRNARVATEVQRTVTVRPGAVTGAHTVYYHHAHHGHAGGHNGARVLVRGTDPTNSDRAPLVRF